MSLIKHIVSRVLSEEYTYLLADWKNKALNNVHYKRELEAINRRTAFYLDNLGKAVVFISFELNKPEIEMIIFNYLRTLNKLSLDCRFSFFGRTSLLIHRGTRLEFDAFMQLFQKDEFLNTGFGDVYCRLRK
jgi:hypothetical protein